MPQTWMRSGQTSGVFGLLDSCIFHPGFFFETLSGFDLPTAVAFVDVDLVDSLRALRTCNLAPASPQRNALRSRGGARRRCSVLCA